MSDLKALTEFRDRLRVTHKSCTSKRDELRLKIEALDSAEARKALTGEHRTKRTIEERTQARKHVRDDAEAMIAQGRATLERRDSLVGISSVLRNARFTTELPPRDWSKVLEPFKIGGTMYDERREQDREAQRQNTNALRSVLEESTRLRWMTELKMYTATELEDVVRECRASNDVAKLALVKREVQSRPASEALVPAKVAITAAMQSIEAPAEVRELTNVLDEIADLNAHLEEAYGEISSGIRRDLTEKVEGLRQATAEHGPVDGPHVWAERRIREREARKGRVATVAKAEATAVEEPKPAA
jgi:hypothetical protein